MSKDLGDDIPSISNRTGTNSIIVPNNYNELLQDQRYENLLRSIYDNLKWMIGVKELLRDDVEDLKLLVERELEQLES